MLKIIADENIFHAHEAFSVFGKIQTLPGRQITHEHLKNADILLVRSVTQVNESLLAETPVKFVGTATIGTDHLDTKYLTENHITLAAAAGCNANAAAEYVITAILHAAMSKNKRIAESTLGIVGVGNIGARVRELAGKIGMKTLLNDPPLKRKTGDPKFRELDELMTADFLTLHVPLIKTGIDKTEHLFDVNRLQNLRNDAVLINAARGAVVDNAALLAWRLENPQATLVLDVWENEPDISKPLLREAFIATPHIAGYTLEGKANGTKMLFDALAEFLHEKKHWTPAPPVVEKNILHLEKSPDAQKILHDATRQACPIVEDDRRLRKALAAPEYLPAHFDDMRKNYPLRREFRNFNILAPSAPENGLRILCSLDFCR